MHSSISSAVVQTVDELNRSAPAKILCGYTPGQFYRSFPCIPDRFASSKKLYRRGTVQSQTPFRAYLTLSDPLEVPCCTSRVGRQGNGCRLGRLMWGCRRCAFYAAGPSSCNKPKPKRWALLPACGGYRCATTPACVRCANGWIRDGPNLS